MISDTYRTTLYTIPRTLSWDTVWRLSTWYSHDEDDEAPQSTIFGNLNYKNGKIDNTSLHNQNDNNENIPQIFWSESSLLDM